MGKPLTIVLDTCALLYWSFAPTELTGLAAKAVEDASRVVVSSISLWEIALKHKRGKLDLPLPATDYIVKLQGAAKVEIVAVETSTWLTNVKLVWDHADPADRTIVATALELNCPLVTSDRRIREFYPQAVW